MPGPPQPSPRGRGERWIEDSGNVALMGCELPPDEVLAADQRITAWAKELRAAGLEGDMDQLPDGTFRWTTPSGRTYTTEPTRYPI